VVNRTYTLRANGGELEAQGSFPLTAYCSSSRLQEHWLLHGENSLEGTLDSTWPTPANCAESCTVHFRVHGLRLTPNSGGP
jgi:hypothetical protein